MAGLLNKAPWNTKSRDQSPKNSTQSESTTATGFLSKAPWASKTNEKNTQAHGENSQSNPVGNFLSKAPWASKPKDPSSNPQSQSPTGADTSGGGGGFFPKAPWSKDNHSNAQDAKEESLTTILATHEDRTNFLLLIAECTETMRKSVDLAFDPNETGEQKDLEGKDVTGSRPATSGTDKGGSDVESVLELQHADEAATGADDDDETHAKAAIAEAEAGDVAEKDKLTLEEKKTKAEAEAKERERKEYEQRVKEVDSEDMRQLKSASLDSFDAWRERVLSRVGEAVNQHDDQQASTEQNTKPISETAQATDPASPPTSSKPDDALIHHFPPHPTHFTALDEPRRVLILHSLLLLMLSLETYSSYSRVLLLHIASSLHLPVHYLSTDESKVAQGLLEAAKKHMNADEETKKAADSNVWGRRLKVGLGTVAGAALIGVTGGLAAPLLAAGIGTVMGGLGLGATATATYLGAMAGSAPLVGALFGAYGGRMAGQIVDNYAKEIADFAFIPVHRPTTSLTQSPADRRLRVTIGISGWLTAPPDVTRPWHVLAPPGSEIFALRFELEALIRLGNALTTYAKSAAWGVASKTVISQTLFATLAAGLWPLGIVKVARVVDNPFSVARSRAEKAGRVLADALINRVQGHRPVVLIGYSLGARVAYFCLDELARRHAFGLVESVVLLGAAVPADGPTWRRIRAVVPGRLVNVFSTRDYLLAFLYRTASLQYGVSGLQPVTGVAGVENIDVSALVDGHTQYRFLTGRILEKIGLEDVDGAAARSQERQMRQEEAKNAQAPQADAEGADEMEAEVERKTEQGFLRKVGERMGQVRLGRGRTPDGRSPEGREKPAAGSTANKGGSDEVAKIESREEL